MCVCVLMYMSVCLSTLTPASLWSQIIVSYPPTKQLSSEEQDLVWKFRYYLTTQEKVCALTSSPMSPVCVCVCARIP